MTGVVGLCFDNDGKRVALIKKTKPDWMRGKLNGIGGKVEPWEKVDDAMAREFEEETGVHTIPPWWQRFAYGVNEYGGVYYYRLFNSQLLEGVRTTTEEEVGIYPVNILSQSDALLKSLTWQIPLALDIGSFERTVTFIDTELDLRVPTY